MELRTDLLEIIEYLNPAELDYQEWLNVGMALKHEGCPMEVWDEWSRNDGSRYHAGECERKWRSFRGSSTPVTAGTIVQLAIDHGWKPSFGMKPLSWEDDYISTEGVVVDKNWVEGKELHEPQAWNPVSEIIRYLKTLFEAGENVGYVTNSWEQTDEKGTRWQPKRGNFKRTAGELIEKLSHCNGDIGAVLGDYNPEAGAWIRYNPLDGNGCKDENVTDFRHALVESDDVELDIQNAIIRELELPVACLVFSGNKSLHAVVKVNAANKQEYKERVDYLYTVCQKNGLKIDTKNKNPSRLSRMPGVERNGKKQYIVDTDIGKENWDEWYEWIEGINDDLPDPEPLESVWDNLPELSPPLIENVLRQGHKMLIAGPSKAGKSFSLIELCIAVAEGKEWFRWRCAQGKILYVNLELDRASCLHRFKDVYQALGWNPENLSNIDIWNLRGKSIPMDKLAPKLIRRAAKKNYTAVIIDPIYKVITGDENSADQMSKFCNQFDKVCDELNAAVIYCHHHSKGSQGGKRAMDRASGSGVFARDPDAILDLIELEPSEALLKQEINHAVCDACMEYLNTLFEDWEDDVSQDAVCSQAQMTAYCKKKLSKGQYEHLERLIRRAEEKVLARTAWRIEGTLREFPKFEPVNLWFDYPIHRADDSGVLRDIQPEAEKMPWQKNLDKKKLPEDKKKERKRALESAYEALSIDGDVTVKALENYFTLTKNAVKNRIKEHEGFEIKNGIVFRKQVSV